MRCRSWRYRHTDGHQGHLPGQCRSCWRPCHARLPKPERGVAARRCEDCTQALLQCPDVAVRKALASEDDLDRSILIALTTDPAGPVAMAAQRRLDMIEEEALR